MRVQCFPAQLSGVCDAAAVRDKEAEQERVIIGWLARRGRHVVTKAEERVLVAALNVPDEALHAPITHAEKLFPLCDAIQRWKGKP